MVMAQLKDDMAHLGDILKGRYRILHKIGGGGFGQVYEAQDEREDHKVAIKLESRSVPRPVLKMELYVLKTLRNTSVVCEYYDCGRTEEFNYIAMQLQGKSLSQLRRERPEGKFTKGTALRVGCCALKAIKVLHDHGFIHRDVKPSNFAIGATPDTSDQIRILDFGLAREYLTQEGELRRARRILGFRGTVRYASLNAHRNKDLSRRDDLISLFYTLVELMTGALPWRRLKDKDEVAQIKRKTSCYELLNGEDEPVARIFNYLRSLTFEDRPNYSKVRRYIEECMRENKVNVKRPLDWQKEQSQVSNSVFENVPLSYKTCGLRNLTGFSSVEDTMNDHSDEWSRDK